MAVLRAMVALALGIGLEGCADAKSTGACAIAVTPEVCQTPATLRGAERVSETWTSAAAPELVPEPLLDGRYMQTARTLYCTEQYDPPPVLSSVQGVLEISGCVIRVTAFLGDAERPLVAVRSFDYRADGTLDLHLECATEEQDIRGARYGFDGTTLHTSDAFGRGRMPNSSGARGPDDPTYSCDYIDTWELR
ncbi:MAG: hypothetical protein ABI895_41795 [Deltaproteobacteria bacterium]